MLDRQARELVSRRIDRFFGGDTSEEAERGKPGCAT
jgi:hypothetical protein